MNTPRQIILYIGEDAAAARLGVSAKTVRNKSWEPRLPAAWYDTLEHLAGRPLPRECFTFKRSGSAA